MKGSRYVGIAGCGYWGKNLLRNFYELGVLDMACDIDFKRLNTLKKRFPDITMTNDFDEMLRLPHIRAVAIATPAITHYELVKRAVLSNKDVFVEKPLAINTKDANRLLALAKEKNKIIMVGHILQYHPAIIKLKELISKGMLGRIQYIYSNRLNLGKLRTEENILWSFAPHDISAILMLLEQEPVRVSAFGESYLNEEVYDTTLTMLEFKNRVKCHIFVSWLHPYKEQRLIIVGSKAMAVFDDLTKEKLFIYPHRIEYAGGKIPVAQKSAYYTVEVEKSEPLKEELKHFVDCVVHRKKPKTDVFESLRVLKILESAEKYLKDNRYGKKK